MDGDPLGMDPLGDRQARIERNRERLAQIAGAPSTSSTEQQQQQQQKDASSDAKRKKDRNSADVDADANTKAPRTRRREHRSLSQPDMGIVDDDNLTARNASAASRTEKPGTALAPAGTLSSAGFGGGMSIQNVRLEWQWRPQANAMPSALPDDQTSLEKSSARSKDSPEEAAEDRRQLLMALKMSLEDEERDDLGKAHLCKSAKGGFAPSDDDLDNALRELDPQGKGYITQADVTRAAQKACFSEWGNSETEDMVTLFSETGQFYLSHDEVKQLIQDIAVRVPKFK
jgi:hypothetical protein